MPALVRPSRQFSFADHAKNRPRDPLPGDRLDAQINNLIEAIHSTQLALSEIRRDDGTLRNASVGLEQLKDAVHAAFADDVADATAFNAGRAEQGAAVTRASERTAQLFARDAEAAAISAAQFLSAVNTAQQIVDQNTHHVTALSSAVDNDATEAENWATYSKAQADNAIHAKEEALAWAEYLAGPVVNAAEAPAYIADSAWPHGLYYQPVEGYGGTGGLWSAKWWAIYAANVVGPWGVMYLGGWEAAPLPGETNPDTGQKVPDPLLIGSIYYDITTGQLLVWNGTQWVSPYVIASGADARLVYFASAGQTVFSGPDLNGHSPVVDDHPSDVHLDGLRLLEGQDYTVDAASNALTLTAPTSAGAVLQWDLLVSPDELRPGTMTGYKLLELVCDGVTQNFTMRYLDADGAEQLVNVDDGAQLQISLDGVVQEVGIDYSASGSELHLATVPGADARLWGIWYKSEVVEVVVGLPEAPLDGQQYARQSADWSVVEGGGSAAEISYDDTASDLGADDVQAAIDQLASDVAAAGSPLLVSDTAPVGAPDNAMWWESDTGLLYVRYNDGNSSQWVIACPQPDISRFVTTAPQTLTMAQQTQARQNIAAAPFDALGWSGIQLNGGCEVNQEGLASRTDSGHIVDGWQLQISGTFVPSLVAYDSATITYFTPLGLPACLAMVPQITQAVLGADHYCQLAQYIEGYRVARLVWGTANAQPLTVGVWVAHSKPGTYSITLRNHNGTRSCAMTYTQNVANTAEYKVVTFPGCPDGSWNFSNGRGLHILFNFASGTTHTAPSAGVWHAANYIAAPGQVNAMGSPGDVIRITGLVVLPGIEAPTAARSPYILRPFDQELLTCQRYYWKDASPTWMFAENVSTGVGGNNVALSFNWPVEMRSAPTISLPTFSLVGISSVSSGIVAPNKYGVTIYGTGNGAAGGRMHFTYASGSFVADARL